MAVVPDLLLPSGAFLIANSDGTVEQGQKADILKFIRYGDSKPSR
jgi:hypothetical protein